MIADIGFTLIVLGVLALCCAVSVGASWLARRWRRKHSTIWWVR